MNILDKGHVSDDEVKAEISTRLYGDLGVLACRIYDNWINAISPIDEMISVVDDLQKKGNNLYLLSNISVGFVDTYSEVKWIKELFSKFDGLVFSGPIGIVKPDKNIYEYLLSSYSLKKEECLFVDDTEKNIIGAQTVGISGYLFDGNVKRLRKYIGI